MTKYVACYHYDNQRTWGGRVIETQTPERAADLVQKEMDDNPKFAGAVVWKVQEVIPKASREERETYIDVWWHPDPKMHPSH